VHLPPFEKCQTGGLAGRKGRKPLLLFGFGVLPIRRILYTLKHVTGALIAIQTLDGVANAIFGIVSILVIKDRTEERAGLTWPLVRSRQWSVSERH